MQNRFRLILCVIVIAAAATWWLWPDASRTPPANSPDRSPAPSASTTNATAEKPAVDRAGDTNNEVAPSPAGETEQSAATTAPDPNNPFRVDSAGKLVLDEQTRLNIEALFAQTDPASLAKAQQASTQKLPPEAAAEALALLERYDNYSKAQRQTYPPGVAPATEEAALAELEGLHALRVAHFGPDTAQAFYGNEEKVTRSLIDLMRLEKDQSLTLEEKAERAQQMYDTRPELKDSDSNSRQR